MIFVIDGVDASGKTTLAMCMAHKLNCQYIHHTFKKHWSQRYLFEHHLDFVWTYNEEEHMVIDRSWPSNIIYGKVFRNNDHEVNNPMIKKVLRILGCTYIFAIPEPILWKELFEKMCEEREEMYAHHFEKLSQVYDEYVTLSSDMFMNEPNCYKYDMHRQDMEKFTDNMIQRAECL